MNIEAKYAGGQSQLPQPRPTASIELAYADGQSGKVPLDVKPAGGAEPAFKAFFHRRLW